MENETRNFDVQIARSIAEIGQETWDRLGQEQPFASYRWHSFGERVLTRDAPSYVVLSLGGEPVARAAFWLVNQEPLGVGPGIIVDRLLPLILRRWPLLVCRSPLASGSGLILPDDPQLRRAALKTLAQVSQDLARQHRASFVVFDYLEHEKTEWAIWPDAFMPVTIPEPGTCMAITWPDFDGYLSQLSRKRRKHYRQHLKRAEEMHLEITLHPVVQDIDKTLALIRNVEERYDEPPFYWTRALLENASMVDAVWIAARVEERLVGCELVLGDRGSWRVMALGRDYEFDYVYFLLGYEDIRYAIENKAQVLHWGTCAYEVKDRLGFRLEDNHHLTFTANNRVLRWLARKAAALF